MDSYRSAGYSGHRNKLEPHHCFPVTACDQKNCILCSVCSILSVFGVFFRPLLQDFRAKRGVDTTPGGVHSHFCDSLQDLTKKRPNVDMWTSCSLLIIQRLCVHSFGGGPWEGDFRGDHAKAHPADCLKANLGGPFRCPRLCLLFVIYVDPVFVIT